MKEYNRNMKNYSDLRSIEPEIKEEISPDKDIDDRFNAFEQDDLINDEDTKNNKADDLE